jgi:cell wall-associated NlpC family hydrolase
MSISVAQIVACARTYIGTPFRHAGRGKGRGMDCVALPLMVAGELGILDTAGQPLTGQTYITYTSQPVDNMVLDLCAKHLVRVATLDRRAGDVVVMRLPRTPCHVGIYAGLVRGRPSLIHAYAGVDKCTEQPIDDKWERRICAVYRFPGVE